MSELLVQKEENYFASKEEYLAMEEKTVSKSEFRNGEVVAMLGGTVNHNTLSTNILTAFKIRLRGKGCRPFNSDMKLDVPRFNHYVYPDCTVICGEIQLVEGRKGIFRNPVLIVEVLSKETANYDRGEKFVKYQSVQGFKEYLMIDSLSFRIESCFRKSETERQMLVYEYATDSILLQSLALTIPIEEIYEGVIFD